MRRQDRQITDPNEIEAILRKAEVCHIALCDGGLPYLVAVNFGFKDKSIYFHCAHEGRKLDIIRVNNNVCFMVDIDREMKVADIACEWSFKYRSVIGTGRAFIVTDPEEKRRGLDIIMAQYSDKKFEYKDNRVAGTKVVRIDIESLSAKGTV